MSHFAKAILATGMLVTSVTSAFAAPNLVQNGDFESTRGVGQIGNVTTLDHWTNTGTSSASGGFNFVIDRNADRTGFPSINSPMAGTNIFVWGPQGTGNGNSKFSNNGFSGSANGGYFIGGDADYGNAAITQTITGLQIGHTYDIGFEWAQGQFTDQDGPTTSGWNVSLGSDTVSTGTPNLPGRGFNGWNDFMDTFTATAASEVLSFLAVGGPSGAPPFAMLDGVTLTDTENTPPPPPPAPTVPAVPEPGTYALFGAGIAFLGLVTARQRRSL